MNGCVEWQGARNAGNYGVSKHSLAHRVAWTKERGPIPKGLFVLHDCDNPPCVNVNHLRLGTHADNMRAMVARGRSLAGDKSASRRKPECLARGQNHGSHTQPESRTLGERNGCSKLTADDVRRMRAWVATGFARRRCIAEAFGISEHHLSAIVLRKRWPHIA